MKKEKVHGVPLKVIGWVTTGFAVVISGLLLLSLFSLANRYNKVRQTAVRYMDWKTTTMDVQLASDYLTDQVRSYVVTRRDEHLYNYFEESTVSQRREKAIESIETYLGNTQVFDNLEIAFNNSKELMKVEYYSMRLIVESKDADVSTYPQEIIDVTLSESDIALDSSGKRERAIELVFGDAYMEAKERISDGVDKAISALDDLMERSVLDSTERLRTIIVAQQVLIGFNIAFLAGLVIMMFFYIVKPVNTAMEKLINEEKIEPNGIKEFRYLANTYNEIFEHNLRSKEKLLYESEHDKLTGLYNRTGYVSIYRRTKLDNAVYLLLDIDNFKEINDKYGHETGDKVLVRVSNILLKYFDTEYSDVFRIGGDEFVVLIEDANEESKENIDRKCIAINEELRNSNKNIPGSTLSIGIAYGEEEDTTDSLYRKADRALYFVKRHGRNQHHFYNKEEENVLK